MGYSLKKVTYENMIARIGEGLFFDILSRQDLIAIVNWTMIPNLTEVLVALLEKVFPNLPPRDHRAFGSPKAQFHPEPSRPDLQERCQHNPVIPFQALVKHRAK